MENICTLASLELPQGGLSPYLKDHSFNFLGYINRAIFLAMGEESIHTPLNSTQ